MVSTPSARLRQSGLYLLGCLLLPLAALAQTDVTLNAATDLGPNSATLSWSQNGDADFGSYRLYRSTSSNVGTGDDLVATITDASTTSFADTGLRIHTTYHYKVFVANDGGTVSSGSNEVSATTTVNVYPFSDDMEGGDESWSVIDAVWSLSTDDAWDGSQSWKHTPDDQSDPQNQFLETRINLAEATQPVLRFYQNYSFDTGVDHGFLQVSTNSGSSWTNIYHITGSSDGSWVEERVDLTEYAGTTLYLRFNTFSNISTWYIDAVQIDETTKRTEIAFPFADDFGDAARTDSLWIKASWDRSEVSSLDETPYMHSRPEGTYPNSSAYRVYTSLTLANVLDLTTAERPVLTFDYQQTDWGGHMNVQVSTDDGRSYSDLATYNATVGWTFTQLSLSGYVGQKIRLRWYVDGEYNTGFWGIDNVVVEEAPDDVTLNAVGVGEHAAELSWTQSTDADFQQYELYRATAPGVTRSSTLMATLTDINDLTYLDETLYLTDQTYYYKMFVVDTQSNASSIGSNEVSVTTPFVTAVSYPFFDDLEGGDANFAEDDPWALTSEAAWSGTSSWLHAPHTLGISSSLYLLIDLAGTNVHKPMLSFYHQYAFETGTNQGYIEISTDAGSSWTRLSATTGSSQESWERQKIDLSQYVGASVYLRWHVVEGEGVWYVDDIRIDETEKLAAIPFPFSEDFNDALRTDTLWQASSWGLTSVDPQDDTPFMHSRPNGNYINSGSHRVYPALTMAHNLDLSTADSPVLTFDYKQTDWGGHMNVQVSTDGGRSYNDLATYNATVGWTFTQLSLTNYVGQQIRLRWLVDGEYNTGFWAIDNVVVEDAPEDVMLFVENNGQHAADLSWTQSLDADFQQYEIYRSTAAGVNRSSALIATIEDIATLAYTDDTLYDTDQTYYYRVFVVDTQSNGSSVGSNEVSVTTPFVETANYPFFDDLEAGDANFAEDQPWALTALEANSGSFSWLHTPHNLGISSALYLPIDLTGEISKPVLSFYHLFEIEAANNQGYVEISTDGGSSWRVLSATTGASADIWTQQRIDLSEYIGASAQLRWRVYDDEGAWLIDDIRIGETEKEGPLGYPFTEDFNNAFRTDSLWHAASWGLTVAENRDGTPYMDSTPLGDYRNSSNPRAYPALTMAHNIDLTDAVNPQLSFYYQQHDWGAHMNVQVSTDGGHSYVDLATYNSTVGWTHSALSLAAYAGQQIRLRWLVDGEYHVGEWSIDDLRIGEDLTGASVVDWAQTEGPDRVYAVTANASEPLYGRVRETGVTDSDGASGSLLAEIGYGAAGTYPTDDWAWQAAVYDSEDETGDRYRGVLTLVEQGLFAYAFRFSIDGGATWMYGDLDGNDYGGGGSNYYSVVAAAHIIVSEAPELVLAETSVDLSLPLGDTGLRGLQLRNTGEGPLSVLFASDAEWLALSAAEVILDPGEAERVLLTFDTNGLTIGETYNATITLLTNDPNQPLASVAVSLTVLSSETTAFTGAVRDVTDDNNPASFATLTLFDLQGTEAATFVTGEDGVFTFYGLPEDIYTMEVIADGFYPTQEAVVVPSNALIVEVPPIPEVTLTHLSAAFWSDATTFDDVEIAVGDVITVMDPDGVICGVMQVTTPGQYGLLYVYGDDPFTEEDEGAEAGDNLLFFINEFAARTNGPDATTWAERGISNVDLDGSSVDELTLRTGWNLISFTVLPADTNIETVLADLLQQEVLEQVNTFDQDLGGAKTYIPGFAFNDLETFDPTLGYWVKLTGPGTVAVPGRRVHSPKPLPLNEGWNLTTYLPENPRTVTKALQTIEGLYEVVSGYDDGAQVFVPGLGDFNDLDTLQNGFSYWVRMANGAVLYYDFFGGGQASAAVSAPLAAAVQQELPVTPTPWWTDYYGNLGDGVVPGDVIEAFDPDGVRVGYALVEQTGQYGLLHVYGDDPNTPDVDEGARPGDAITFRINGEIAGVADTDALRWTGDRTYQALDLDATATGTEDLGALPTDYGLDQNYPNPFNPTTTIQYQLPEAAFVTLSIYDALGRRVAVLVRSEQPAGRYTVEWDAAQLGEYASGVYFYHLQAGAFSQSRKMILLK